MKKIFKKLTRPKTMFLYPVGESFENNKKDLAPQSGIALMVAVMIISVMMMFAAEFIVSSTVDLTRAAAQRDNVRAEYVAKSGANWALWLNLFDYGLQLQLGADPSTKAMKDGIGPLWDKLDAVFSFDMPLDLSQADKFAAAVGLSGIMDSALLDLFKSLGGELGVKVIDESGKINLNVCYQQKVQCDTVIMQLEALMGCTAVEQDYNRQGNIKPNEIVRRIRDWVDSNSVVEPGSGNSDENEAYEKRKAPHKSKNSPLDSLNELLFVDGWNRELHAYYSPYLTVWPFVDTNLQNAAKINVNTMPQEALRCMFGKELGSPEAMEKFIKKYRELIVKNGRIAGSDSEINNVINELTGYKSDSQDLGKPADKLGWLSTESKAFRIKAKGIVGEQTRISEYVIQRSNAAQMNAAERGGPWSLSYFRMY